MNKNFQQACLARQKLYQHEAQESKDKVCDLNNRYECKEFKQCGYYNIH